MHTSSVRLQDTKTPLLASIVANFVNLGLDLFLMFGLGWGVAGAAIATSVSQYISFAILYWKMRTSPDALRFPCQGRFHPERTSHHS